MVSRCLQDVDDLEPEEIQALFAQAKAFKEILNRPIRKVPTLRGKGVLLFFAEPSTRTRASFETAAKILSADVTSITSSTSSLLKGESLADTFLTLSRLPFDLVVVRHPFEGMPGLVFKWFGKTVINGGDGCHAHPTQALLDAFTAQEKLGSLNGITVTYVGDLSHSRVFRSGTRLFQKLGARVAACAPPYFVPLGFQEAFPDVGLFRDVHEALRKSDTLIVLRVQKEREAPFYSEREYERLYGIDGEKLTRAKKGMVVMHPGPVVRGYELKREVLENEKTLILDQVENGVAVRMALLYMFLTGENRLEQ